MIARLIVAATAALLCTACAGAAPNHPAGTQLAPCPSTPNCVSSRESDESHRVDPLPLRGAAAEGLALVRQVVLAMPRARVVAEGPGFLHAEFRSLLFRFVDDVDFVVDEQAGVIHVRSAARVGRSDLGVNRKRVAEIRDRLAALPSVAPEGNR